MMKQREYKLKCQMHLEERRKEKKSEITGKSDEEVDGSVKTQVQNVLKSGSQGSVETQKIDEAYKNFPSSQSKFENYSVQTEDISDDDGKTSENTSLEEKEIRKLDEYLEKKEEKLVSDKDKGKDISGEMQ